MIFVRQKIRNINREMGVRIVVMANVCAYSFVCLYCLYDKMRFYKSFSNGELCANTTMAKPNKQSFILFQTNSEGRREKTSYKDSDTYCLAEQNMCMVESQCAYVYIILQKPTQLMLFLKNIEQIRAESRITQGKEEQLIFYDVVFSRSHFFRCCFFSRLCVLRSVVVVDLHEILFSRFHTFIFSPC